MTFLPYRGGTQSVILLQTKTELTQKLQQIQQMLSIVSPSDTQFIETLKTQQAELTKQLRDVMQQLQTPDVPNTDEVPSVPPGGMMPGRLTHTPERDLTPPRIHTMPAARPENPVGVPPNYQKPVYDSAPPYPPYAVPPGYSAGMPYPTENEQDRAWEMTPWGPRLPKELTEMKQAIESLKKEIGDLKETIQGLEAQIQLLNRNIVLSEKVTGRYKAQE